MICLLSVYKCHYGNKMYLYFYSHEVIYTLVEAAPGSRNFKPMCISSNGYKYTEWRRNKNGTVHYRCADRKCNAIITLRGGDWVEADVHHNHPSKPGLLKGNIIILCIILFCSKKQILILVYFLFKIILLYVLRLNIVMIIILSAEQIKQKAILDGLLNVFRGAPDVVEDAMDLGESEEPCHARPKYENLVRLVNKRRRTNRPTEPSKADIDFEVLTICYLVHIMLYVL